MRRIRVLQIISILSFLIISILNVGQVKGAGSVSPTSCVFHKKFEKKKRTSALEVIHHNEPSSFQNSTQKKSGFDLFADELMQRVVDMLSTGCQTSQSKRAIKDYLIHNYPFHAFW
jgi:hypothetical protein